MELHFYGGDRFLAATELEIDDDFETPANNARISFCIPATITVAALSRAGEKLTADISENFRCEGGEIDPESINSVNKKALSNVFRVDARIEATLVPLEGNPLIEGSSRQE